MANKFNFILLFKGLLLSALFMTIISGCASPEIILFISNGSSQGLEIDENISELDLSNREIVSLEITSLLPAIEKIDLSNNQIDGGKKIVGIQNLSGLKELNISGNSMNKLELSNMEHLSSLDISNNNMTEIMLSDLPQLTEIQFTGNILNKVVLNNLPSIEILDLKDFQINLIEISGLSRVKEIYLNNNEISKIVLAGLPVISFINLHKNRIESMENIIGLETLLSIERLKISDNDLQQALIRDLPQLYWIDLSGNKLIRIDLDNLPNLANLHLSENPIPPATCQSLAGKFPACSIVGCSTGQ